MKTPRKQLENRTSICRICFERLEAGHKCDENKRGIREALLAWGAKQEKNARG